MLARTRQGLWLIVAAVLGYLAGTGPVSAWGADLTHLVMVEWNIARVSRAGGGAVPLLVAGFLIGQGGFLLARQVLSRLGPARARRSERIASWDPALLLGTRFGLHRFLQRCAQWAAEDPTARVPSLALFKIRGLGALNDAKGTLVTTDLLQRVAVELRAAALPESATGLTRWLSHHLPRPVDAEPAGVAPRVRYAARWSGATFALAFRELEPLKVIGIVRDVASFIRSELDLLGLSDRVQVVAGLVVGAPNITPRGLATAATNTLDSNDGRALVVAHHPTEVQATMLAQMSDVIPRVLHMDCREPAGLSEPVSLETSERVRAWLRSWGPGLGLIALAVFGLEITSAGGSPRAMTYPWPDSLADLQIVDSTGPRRIRLLRSQLEGQKANGWQLSQVKIVQGDLRDGSYSPAQIHVTIINTTRHSYYVSTYDFQATDSNGVSLSFDPKVTFRLAKGITGQWLAPGASWSGWLQTNRRTALVRQLVFEPDLQTRIVASAYESP